MKNQFLQVASDTVGPDDPRYAVLVSRGFNKRFSGKPTSVRLVNNTAQVVDAVQSAVHDKARIAARSGGHCLESFVDDPAVQVVIDTSLMADIYYDPDMGAFAIEAGATLGEMYRKLFLGWGLTIPAGISPSIGVGGHILGGAFGFLSRQYGLAADHLYGVEVVVVDESGHARSVTATREPSDPNHDLWWAHTGGGGGNFGIVTRYWLRSPGAGAADPMVILPKAPASVLRFKIEWNWDDLGQAAFTRLLRNFGQWVEENSAAESPYARLYSTLVVPYHAAGEPNMTGMVTAGPQSEALLDGFLAAVNGGVGVQFIRAVDQTTWLSFALYPFPDLVQSGSVGVASKLKDASLRKRLTDSQIATAYHHLTRTDAGNVAGTLGMATYGGMINTVDRGATASAQRDSIIAMACSTGWMNPQDETRSLAWVRQFYQELFAETGGVPAPSAGSNGALINHPDADLADLQWNTSGIPWHTLYYQENYPRLQQVKARWDPLNIFHHTLSIHPPGE